MCQIPTGRPLTSSYVWHFLFLITAGTDQASFFFRGGGALWIFSARLFSALLNGCGCSAAIRPPEVFRMSWAQLYRPGSGCFVFPLRERIIRQGFDIYFPPFWFLTVTRFYFFPLVYFFYLLLVSIFRLPRPTWRRPSRIWPAHRMRRRGPRLRSA